MTSVGNTNHILYVRRGPIHLTRVALAFALASPVMGVISLLPEYRSALYAAGTVFFVLCVVVLAGNARPRASIGIVPAFGLIAAALLLMGSGQGGFLSCSLLLALSTVLAFSVRKLGSTTFRWAVYLRRVLTAASLFPVVVLVIIAGQRDLVDGIPANMLDMGTAGLVATAIAVVVAWLMASGFRAAAPPGAVVFVACCGVALAEYWLAVPDSPPIAYLFFNYQYYIGAALQFAFSGHIHFGVSQYGTGPIAAIRMAQLASGGGYFAALALALLVANAVYAGVLAMMARRFAGSYVAIAVALAVPALSTFSVDPLITTPSVAGLRFLPLAVLGLAGLNLVARTRPEWTGGAGGWLSLMAVSVALAVGELNRSGFRS